MKYRFKEDLFDFKQGKTYELSEKEAKLLNDYIVSLQTDEEITKELIDSAETWTEKNMNKYLLIAIRPEWLYLILIGKKLLEIRKFIPIWVKEEVAKGNTVKCLFYCTKRKPYLFYNSKMNKFKLYNDMELLEYGGDLWSGKIVCEFDLNKIDEITIDKFYGDFPHYLVNGKDNYQKLLKESCLNINQLEDYLKDKNGLALHIDNLTIFDIPKELGEFCHHDDVPNCPYTISQYLKRPPQNCCCVYGE